MTWMFKTLMLANSKMQFISKDFVAKTSVPLFFEKKNSSEAVETLHFDSLTA